MRAAHYQGIAHSLMGIAHCEMPTPFHEYKTNKQKNRPEARTDARDKAREQDERRHTSEGTRTHRRKDKSQEQPNQEHLRRASHLSHP